MAESGTETSPQVEEIMAPSYASAIFIALAAVLVGTLLYRRFTKPRYNLPPGPRGLPIVGTLFQTKSPVTHKVMKEMAKKWGPVMTIWSGVRPVILITGAKEAHEALIEKGTVYASRGQLQSRRNFTGYKSVNSALYGPYWRAVRKNLVSQVTSSSKVAAFAPFREAELATLFDRMRKEASERDGVVAVLPHLRLSVFSILFHICFGKRFDETTVKQLDKVLRRLLVLLSPQVIDFIPIINYFSSKHKKECQEHLGVMRATFGPLFEEHRQNQAKGIYRGDYVDSLLDLQKKIQLTETDMLGLVGEVLTAGADTTANTLNWTLALLVTNPDKQQKLYEEISRVCGDQLVAESDLEKMPYLQAVALESLRRYPPLPFGITHGVTEQTTIAGYDVPAYALVLVHLEAIQNDPSIWKDPELFIPERFLDQKLEYDITGTKTVTSSPFGIGRRICPGMSLGLTHIHLILARLVQAFEFFADPVSGLDFEERLEFTTVMVHPLNVLIKERTSRLGSPNC